MLALLLKFLGCSAAYIGAYIPEDLWFLLLIVVFKRKISACNLSRNQKSIEVCTKSNFWLCVSVSIDRVTRNI